MNRDMAIEYIIDLEGGYVNHPNDPGGETKFGISKKAFPDIDIAKLELAQAKEIYRKNYWDNIKGDLLPHGVGLIVFDAAVNHGVFKATTLLQRCLKIKEDGILGPATFQAIKALQPQTLISMYAMERHRLYTSNPQWESFGKGWMKRLILVSMMSAFFSRTGL